ncbi:MAG: hypothetical protein KGL40_12610 [Rhodocyclaceae bacterium]|nr:hypothetical protein [Rhodocyclaceae bacterium]
MSTILKTIINSIKNIGQPVGLMRLLAEYQEFHVPLDQPNNSIAARSVIHWHELGDSDSSICHSRYQRGNLLGWKTTGNRHQSFEVPCPELAQVGQREIVENWSCDISDVYGVVSRNPRFFRHPSSSPATSASRSIILPSLWKV